MWSSSSGARALIVCASMLAVTNAAAQTADAPEAHAPSPADIAAAKAQFAEALDLRASGDLAGALQHFRSAFDFVPTPITELEVGRTLVQLDRLAEAHATLLEAANMPKKPNESERAAQSRTEAAKLASELEGRLGTLTLKTDADAESITIDDKPIAPGARDPVLIAPGHHVVIVKGPKGRTGRAEVDVAAGERKDVAIPLPLASADVAPPPTRLRISPVAYAGFGVAAAGVLVGLGTGIGAFVTASNVKRDCPNSACPPSAHDELNTSLALGTTSTIAFIVGGVGAAVGVIGLVISKRVPVEQTALWLGPGSVTLKGEF